MIDVTLVREIVRRLRRSGSKGYPSGHGYCDFCGQNEARQQKEIIEVIEAVAAHAEAVTKPSDYSGIYVAGGAGALAKERGE